jgi:CheY-like chemotaxis protein
LLSTLGIESVVVENGQEAVLAIQSTRFDLVLMDCQMPVMDGYVTKPIKRDALAKALGEWLTATAVAGAEARGAGIAESKPAPAVEPPVLDEAVFARLASLMGDGMADHIETYLADIPAQLAAMNDAIVERDLLGLGRAAHSLESSSAALGAAFVEIGARELESHARAGGSFVEARQLVEAVRRAFELARPRLNAGLHAVAVSSGSRGRGS